VCGKEARVDEIGELRLQVARRLARAGSSEASRQARGTLFTQRQHLAHELEQALALRTMRARHASSRPRNASASRSSAPPSA
jgi:hypothetical protein